MVSSEEKKQRLSRWYFGGLASAGAACFTHPLDLLKVTLQTQQEGKLSVVQLTSKVIKQQGIFSNTIFIKNEKKIIFKIHSKAFLHSTMDFRHQFCDN